MAVTNLPEEITGRIISECFGHRRLRFEIYLDFGAWELGFHCITKTADSTG